MTNKSEANKNALFKNIPHTAAEKSFKVFKEIAESLTEAIKEDPARLTDIIINPDSFAKEWWTLQSEDFKQKIVDYLTQQGASIEEYKLDWTLLELNRDQYIRYIRQNLVQRLTLTLLEVISEAHIFINPFQESIPNREQALKKYRRSLGQPVQPRRARHWKKQSLEYFVKQILSEIGSKYDCTLERVASEINRNFLNNPHVTADSLRKLLKRNGIDWKKLKARAERARPTAKRAVFINRTF